MLETLRVSGLGYRRKITNGGDCTEGKPGPEKVRAVYIPPAGARSTTAVRFPYHRTVSEMVVVWVVVPLVPVMVRVPVVALLLALMVMVEVPAQVIEVGLKEMVVRLACPEADNAIAELRPPVTVEVTVTVPEVVLRKNLCQWQSA